MTNPVTPSFFATPADFRKWFEKNHEREPELLVGFYKTDSGKPSITWPESVDVALCFGWIDAVRRRIDDESYSIRFTRRKPTSTWSAINIAKVAELTRSGMMTPAGLKAFAARKDAKSGIYSYEQKEKQTELPAEFAKRFQAKKKAWKYFNEQPPWYRRTSTHWVTSAKKEETQLRRLETLMTCSGSGEWIPSLRRTPAT